MMKNEDDENHKSFHMLMLVIGDAAKKKFKGFGITTEDKTKSMKEILDKIEARVKEEIPVLLERLKFFALSQEEDETHEEFCKQVENAAKLCKFKNISEETMIRDRVIFGSIDKTLAKKFFQKDETTLTLDQVKLAGKANEATAKFMNEMGSSATSSVKKLQSQWKSKIQKHRQSEQNTTKSCTYCGEKHERGKCPAYGKICGYCKMKNHFEKVCGRKQQEDKPKKVKNFKRDDEEESETEALVEKIIDNSKAAACKQSL